MPVSSHLSVRAIHNIPSIKPGADLSGLIMAAVTAMGIGLESEDILVVAQKIVSKAEGRVVMLSDINPSPFAIGIAKQYGGDSRHIEVVLQESSRIVRMDWGVLITETHHGFICANAGVDSSNALVAGSVCLLPENPDASSRDLRNGIEAITGLKIGVIITDTFNRPWRLGTTNVAIGTAGVYPFTDYRGLTDANGYEMNSSYAAFADQVAGAAELVMGKTDDLPVALVRGLSYASDPDGAQQMRRSPELDLFR